MSNHPTIRRESRKAKLEKQRQAQRDYKAFVTAYWLTRKIQSK